MLLTLTSLLKKVAGRVHQTLVHGLFRIFERILPARGDHWCFATWERYAHTLDNPRAVFEEVKQDPSIRKIVLQKRPGEAAKEGVNVKFVPAESVRGAYYLARSRIVLTGYAVRAMTSYSRRLRRSRHRVVQLWHGVPLKRIARLFPGETFWDDETPRYAATVCSSDRDRAVMTKAFAPLARERVWLTGLPRNDLILKPEAMLPADYRRQLDELDELTGGERLVLYAPTWREDPESLYVFSAAEEDALANVLEKHGAVMAIRGHPNVRRQEAYARRRSAARIVSVNDFPEANLILRRTDVLITDYSSIYIDFLVLDRPVLHFAYDLDAYVEERGFLYDLEEAFGGACVHGFDDLVVQLDAALEDSSHGARRRSAASRLFHEHGDRAAADVSRRIRALGMTPTPSTFDR